MSRGMKVVIPGGAGHIGTFLARTLAHEGHDVVVLSRTPRRASSRMRAWDGETLGDWTEELEEADVLINLAGRSVNCRYGSENRRTIRDSRVLSTKVLAEAVARARRPPRVWLQASTATIYAHRFDADNDEETGLLGGQEPGAPETWRFSIEVAKAWERAFEEAAVHGTRKVLLRSGIVMSPYLGGAFDTLLRIVRFGLGGRAGDGRQYVSWIHSVDFVRTVFWLIEHGEIEGAVNVTAPTPLSNVDFMRALRDAWGRRFGLPAAGWLLEVGAFFLRTESELILKSRRVVPGRLLREGFSFRYPTWPEAARSLCREWRALNSRSGSKSVREQIAS